MSTHFIGLGGIGMSALARLLLQKGESVKGSDVRESLLLQELKKEGAQIQIGHSEEFAHGAERVIYSSSIQKENVEWLWAKKTGVPVMHRSELLSELMEGKQKLLVTGTHGKTTTTALLAQVFLTARLDPSFAVGGLIRSLATNARLGKGDHFIIEADESDGSFLKPVADVAIVTNLEDDHLDYWGSSRMLQLGFKQFIAQAKQLFWCIDDARLKELNPKGCSYGFSEGAMLHITHFKQVKNGIIFDLNGEKEIFLSLFGRHNALNGAAVFGLALSLNIPEELIRKAFAEFSGTARRLECKGEKHKVVLYDDYAHHPTEIRETLAALSESIFERRLIAVFQPHRYSRVQSLWEEFTQCFERADLVAMTDIYSAGEAPIPGITSASLFAKLREKLGPKVHFFPRTHLESGVASLLKPLDVVITLGAGDVTYAGESILNLYEKRAPHWNVAVLYGGASPEHLVSAASAKNIVKALKAPVYNTKEICIAKEGKWTLEQMAELMQCDVCIPVFHGPKGEDGMAAAVLEALQIPYVGCNSASGAICMHKGWTKEIAMQHNVPVVPFFQMDRSDFKEEKLLDQIEKSFSYPVWIKPVHLGSSIGVSRVVDGEEAILAAQNAFALDDQILVEKEIVGRQIEFSLLGNEIIQCAAPGEIVSLGEFVSYDRKYGELAFEIRAPAVMSENEREIGYELAKRIFRACNCTGLARVDFFLDGAGYFWLNEINPFPGFTDTSAYPIMWQATGLDLSALVDQMVALGLKRSLAH